jgi:hypothetical protein
MHRHGVFESHSRIFRWSAHSDTITGIRGEKVAFFDKNRRFVDFST